MSACHVDVSGLMLSNSQEKREMQRKKCRQKETLMGASVPRSSQRNEGYHSNMGIEPPAEHDCHVQAD